MTFTFTVDVDVIEGIWITGTGLATALTLWALREALRDADVVRHHNGTARGIVARGTVRREWLRLLVQLLFFAVVVPSVFSDEPNPLTPAVALFLVVPFLVLGSTASDLYDRRRLYQASREPHG